LNLRLDTHVVLWSLDESDRLTPELRRMLEDPENAIWVSSISIWEIFIKAKIGKIRIPEGLSEAIGHQDMMPLPFTAAHAKQASFLPMHHKDPFDRALLGQAVEEKLIFITADTTLRQYVANVQLLLVD